MAFSKKEWKDRISEFPGRRRLVDVDTGVESVVDVTRDEGFVSQAGDAFSATNMNDLEQRIDDAVTESASSSASIANNALESANSANTVATQAGNTASSALSAAQTANQTANSALTAANNANTTNTEQNTRIGALEDQLQGWKIRVMSLSEYNNLSTKDANTIYHCW